MADVQNEQDVVGRAADAPEGASVALLDAYVEVLLRVGINLQPEQTLVIQSMVSPGMRAFAHRVAGRAYALGAGDVIVHWRDASIRRLRALHASERAWNRTPLWEGQEYDALDREGAAYLFLSAPDTDAMAGVDPARLAAMRRAIAQVLVPHYERQMSDQHVWCVAAVATPEWARLVFPDRPEHEALTALWQVIFSATRANAPDPLRAWQDHIVRLESIQRFLNDQHFARLRYRAPGTDLIVALPERHYWLGVTSTTPQGTVFVANIPTEEVFTLPLRTGVEGTVRSSLPIEIGGRSVEYLSLTFERGRIVRYDAETGADALREVIETDDGSHYLGEVALAPITSPCNIGRPMHDVLFDENAACHLAIGDAYATTLVGGQTMTQEQLAAAGANSSTQHVDFMVGSPDLLIEGERASGERMALIEHGNWAGTLLDAVAARLAGDGGLL